MADVTKFFTRDDGREIEISGAVYWEYDGSHVEDLCPVDPAEPDLTADEEFRAGEELVQKVIDHASLEDDV